LKEAGVLSLAVSHRVERRCDDRGNCGVERSTFLFRDGAGEVREGALVDLWLRLR
jgi:hypothetical protein